MTEVYDHVPADSRPASHEEVDSLLEVALKNRRFYLERGIARSALHRGDIVLISDIKPKHEEPAPQRASWRFVVNPGEEAQLVAITRQHGKLSGLVHETVTYEHHPNSIYPHRNTFGNGHSMTTDEVITLMLAVR